jgi:uncharacterized damage-inducible protein DinB
MIIGFMTRSLALLAVLSASLYGQVSDYGQGWVGEFDHASRQLLALAEATPEEKFSWRPAPGIRSTSEVYMHVVSGNYMLLGMAGVAVETKPARNAEKTVTAKAEVIRWLKASQDAVRAAYPAADLKKPVKFFNKPTTADAVFLRLLVHSHEHMGQAIAYARMSGIVPPWSAQ